MSDYMSKKIITCDIDGVLTDYPSCWLKFLKEQTGNLYNSTEIAKIKEPKYAFYKDLYRESNYKATLPINEQNKLALNQLAEKYDIIFTTSRPLNNKKYPSLKKNTYNWLKNNGLIFEELIFKDEDCKFLENLNFEFHIDDESKYANNIAKWIKKNGYSDKCKVYLINSNNNTGPIEKNVNIINNIQEIIEQPFFSVCIPATNREDTIFNSLNSVAKQSYRNFELIIVDCKSNDNTVSEIERFFMSEEYKNNQFRYIFEKRNYTPIGTEDWNEPIHLATGKYIAMLEGDDQWLPNHLKNAYNILSKNQNIGVYGSSNLTLKRDFQGILKNEKAKNFCYIMKSGVVPPSESIFIRINKNNDLNLYNSNDYNYSPEIALYLDIVLNGYDLYYSQNQDVYREPSTNKNKFQTWYYFADRFVLIDNYASFFTKKIVLQSKISNGILTCKSAFYTKSFKKWITLIKNLNKQLGIIITIICILIALLTLFVNLFPFLLKKIMKKFR